MSRDNAYYQFYKNAPDVDAAIDSDADADYDADAASSYTPESYTQRSVPSILGLLIWNDVSLCFFFFFFLFLFLLANVSLCLKQYGKC